MNPNHHLRIDRQRSLPPTDLFKRKESPTCFVGTYEIPISRIPRTSSYSLFPPSFDSGYRSGNLNTNVHGQTPVRFTHQRARSATLSLSSPSTRYPVISPSRLLMDGAFCPPCAHEGADWEDCRIMIQCFGVGNGGRHLYRGWTNRNTRQWHYGALGQGEGIRNAPTWIMDRQTRTAHVPDGYTRNQVVARSVRLSIVPLNPIYKRKFRAKTRLISRAFAQRLVAKPHLYSWYKRLIQKMAFKIDDFTIQEDQVKTAKDVFKRYDKRGQDKISTTDLGPAFRALNLKVKPDTLKEWADQVDDDATGFIDFNGFLICYGKSLQEEQDERDLRDAFRVLDKNKRGEIDVEDLRWILKELGDDLTEEEIDDMIRDTDTDGSGFVDFDEFYKLMTSE
ncbi:Calcium-binding protein [Paragonimus heterotremus]|uniref:Calcium-binding protein n=1 Tax=Paragonimus heterotremus TaxID=100268 RepID=A0A8J4TPC7_9TREM|nr:Calcium-binding protein [Paragonimus heterotremus]